MNLQTALVHESTKVNRSLDRELPGLDRIQSVAGKGDWAAFQVLLLGDEDYTLTVGDSPAFSPKGSLANVRLQVKYNGRKAFPTSLHVVGFIDDDDGTLKSDILLKNETVHVGKGEIQPVWVEIEIPTDADAGVYQGEVQILSHSMFEDEKVVGGLKFELDVKNVTMPAPGEYSFHLDLWQHLSNIARKHEVYLWSDEHFAVIEEYVKSLAALGQKAVTVIASEIPWSGQGCTLTKDYPPDLFEYSMIRVEKDRSGLFHYDYSVMERYIKLCFQYGIDREIEVFGLTNIWVIPEEGFGAVAHDYPDAIRIRYLDRSDGCYKYMKSGVEIKEYIRALEQYFIQKGWIDRVLIVADEPADVSLYRQRLDLLKELAPSFRFKTAINHVEFIDAFKDEVQDFVPALQCAVKSGSCLKS